jgi:hypothetical protein
MSEAEPAKPRIAETFIAAYCLSIFFQFTPIGLLNLVWHWRYFFRASITGLVILGFVCLAAGVSLLLQRNWAKTAAVFLSGIIMIAVLIPFLASVAPRGESLVPRTIYAWPVMAVHVIVNGLIVWYLARS